MNININVYIYINAYMHVCIYLRKERCGCAAGGRAASNIEAYLYCCGGGAAFFFHATLLPSTSHRVHHSPLHAKGYARTNA